MTGCLWQMWMNARQAMHADQQQVDVSILLDHTTASVMTALLATISDGHVMVYKCVCDFMSAKQKLFIN